MNDKDTKKIIASDNRVAIEKVRQKIIENMKEIEKKKEEIAEVFSKPSRFR